MNKPIGLYRRVMRAYVAKLRSENRKLRERNKELETMSFALGRREQQLAELERLLIARSQHYDSQNPRVRRKVIRLRNTMLERQDG
jgi:uncharacterized protein involved in exopolysaccharide biosynthesis